ncbi:MAG: TRAP transporter small permease [Campylobacteraceae bacterium]|jgi:C4-dicarboxylate transporter DctQ subunit|nr:TRAP transporter small permease [Campylobacteraceae bacterium]
MFKKAFYWFDFFVAAMNKSVAVFGMAFGVILAFVNVVLRYVFDGGISWAGELTNYLFIWSALFGAAYGFKKGIHISVTILLSRFPAKVAKFFMVLANLFSCLFLLFMAYMGVRILELIASFNERSIDLQVAMWIPVIVLPIAFAAAAFRTGEKVVEIYRTPADKVIKSADAELIHDSVEKE